MGRTRHPTHETRHPTHETRHSRPPLCAPYTTSRLSTSTSYSISVSDSNRSAGRYEPSAVQCVVANGAPSYDTHQQTVRTWRKTTFFVARPTAPPSSHAPSVVCVAALVANRNMQCHNLLAFCAAAPLGRSPAALRVSTGEQSRARRVAKGAPRATLSERFPVPDPFTFPSVAFTHPALSPDLRPELVGACLWGVGLYLGFSQRVRWGTAVQNALNSTLLNFLPFAVADVLSSVFHTLPFVVAAFTTDALLRYASAGSATWAVASGLSVAMYGGVYELGRLNARTKKLTDTEEKVYLLFTSFAERSLIPTGRCHLIDIRDAIRADSKARTLSTISDETLRRFIRNKFPKAKRSPNGFYRGLSIRQL